MAKLKVLFWVTEFWQAGGQRYTYEIDKAIDKNKFDVHFLSFRDLDTHDQWDDFYYQKHVDVGSKIHFYSSYDPDHLLISPESRRHYLKRKKLLSGLQDFLMQFDFILLQGEWVYRKFQRCISEELESRCYISILNSVAQFPENYKGFDRDKHYNFISAFSEEAIKFELDGFNSYSHYHLPLAINLDNLTHKWDVKSLNKKRIGIFTRLTKTKPIEPLFYAFQILLNLDPSYELYVYGNGDPSKVGFMDHLRYLNIADRVKFMGHQTNMLGAAGRDEIGVTWFLGFHGMPAGFAGYDICSMGIPQVFWDLKPGDEYDSGIIPMFNNIQHLANFTHEIFMDFNKAEELSNQQFSYVQKERNIATHILDFEKFLIEKFNDQ